MGVVGRGNSGDTNQLSIVMDFAQGGDLYTKIRKDLYTKIRKELYTEDTEGGLDLKSC